jgi:hypothetical protein
MMKYHVKKYRRLGRNFSKKAGPRREPVAGPDSDFYDDGIILVPVPLSQVQKTGHRSGAAGGAVGRTSTVMTKKGSSTPTGYRTISMNSRKKATGPLTVV